MKEYKYPEVYDVWFQNSYHDDEPTKNGEFITTQLLESIIKKIRPRFDYIEKIFCSMGHWRIRVEAQWLSGKYYYVLDVGEGFGYAAAEDFKAKCLEEGSASPSIAFCGNLPAILADTEQPGIKQECGTIRVYAMKENGFSSDTGKRLADDAASVFVDAVHKLGSRFLVVDDTALRLR